MMHRSARGNGRHAIYRLGNAPPPFPTLPKRATGAFSSAWTCRWFRIGRGTPRPVVLPCACRFPAHLFCETHHGGLNGHVLHCNRRLDRSRDFTIWTDRASAERGRQHEGDRKPRNKHKHPQEHDPSPRWISVEVPTPYRIRSGKIESPLVVPVRSDRWKWRAGSCHGTSLQTNSLRSPRQGTDRCAGIRAPADSKRCQRLEPVCLPTRTGSQNLNLTGDRTVVLRAKIHWPSP